MTGKLLEVKHLRTSFFTAEGEVKSVGDVSYYVDQGEIIAIVGESGCGKSVTQMSVMQLVQTPPGKILGGEVLFEGKNILEQDARSKEMRGVRRGAKAAGLQNIHDFSGANDLTESGSDGGAAADGRDPHPRPCKPEGGMEKGGRGTGSGGNPGPGSKNEMPSL